MSGILANSTSKTMVSGDTSADNSVSGYITGEQITLSVYPAATSSVAWAEAIPSGSAAARSALSASTGASTSFTPDVGGFYTITALVDGVTTYVLRLSVSAVAVSTPEEVLRLQQVTDAQVPAPSGTTLALYNSSDQSGLATKDSAGSVAIVLSGGTWTQYTPTFGSVGGDASIGDGTIQAYYRKVGDSIELNFMCLFGSTSVLGTGAFIFSLPVGFTIDASKTPFGAGILMSSGWVVHGSSSAPAVVERQAATQLQLIPLGDTGGLVGATNPFAFTTGDEIGFSAVIPVTVA